MSNSSLWVIHGDWSGKCYAEYRNSWLFPPFVWDTLLCKYIEVHQRIAYGRIQTNYLTWVQMDADGKPLERWRMLNERINNSDSQTDRVLWEFANNSVFNAKDKGFVAERIDAFAETYIIGNPEFKDAEHIIQRFHEIAEDVRNLPESVKFFVFKQTDVDDHVEWWFNRKLCSWEKWVCEFTLIEDRKVTGFASNLEMCVKPTAEVNNGQI